MFQKKLLKCLFFVLVLSLLLSGSCVHKQPIGLFFDSTLADKGLLRISITSPENVDARVIIKKDNFKYAYTIDKKSSVCYLPLQMGSGKYNICLFQKNNEDIFIRTFSKDITARIDDGNQVFLNSNQYVRWNASNNACKTAASLSLNRSGDLEKMKAIYYYMVDNIMYDYEKYNTLSKDYLPDVDTVLNIKKGICFDFASTFAAMLRSVSIPSKLVMGYTKNANGYHAWNEVYLDTLGKWVVIDTSYDSQLREKRLEPHIFKAGDQYEKEREY